MNTAGHHSNKIYRFLYAPSRHISSVWILIVRETWIMNEYRLQNVTTLVSTKIDNPMPWYPQTPLCFGEMRFTNEYNHIKSRLWYVGTITRANIHSNRMKWRFAEWRKYYNNITKHNSYIWHWYRVHILRGKTVRRRQWPRSYALALPTGSEGMIIDMQDIHFLAQIFFDENFRTFCWHSLP